MEFYEILDQILALLVLASQLDPEDLRDVVRAYQATCAEVIRRFDGHPYCPVPRGRPPGLLRLSAGP